MEWVKKHKKALALNIVLILLSLFCFIGFGYVSGVLNYIKAGERWQGESELACSYVSCFMPVNGKIEESTVYSFKQTVDSKMVEASLEAPENGSLWNFAYSGTGMVTASTERASAEVLATGIGGDFFFFHQPYLRSGSYISGNDLMQDLVVLDKELAWKLFGATEVAGMEMLIGGNRYIVAGVIEADNDFASEKAKVENAGLYMSYTKLSELTGAKIDCYEAVIPNPVKGFAMNIMNESFPSSEGEKIEISSRYGIKNMLSVIGSFGVRSMRTDGIIFPEWENAARLTEDYCAALLLFGTIFAVVPFIFAAVLCHRYGKKYGAKALERLKEKAEKIKDDYNRRIYERNLAEKQQNDD